MWGIFILNFQTVGFIISVCLLNLLSFRKIVAGVSERQGILYSQSPMGKIWAFILVKKSLKLRTRKGNSYVRKSCFNGH